MQTSRRSGFGGRRPVGAREINDAVRRTIEESRRSLEAKLSAALTERDALRVEVESLRVGAVSREAHEAAVAAERRAHTIVGETLAGCVRERDELKDDIHRLDRALAVTRARCDSLPGLIEEALEEAIADHEATLRKIWKQGTEKLVNRLRAHLFGEEAAR
jgi:ribosomal protein L31E